jgi:outer membrane protein OmpA-like peptidoglycan-associated protein
MKKNLTIAKLMMLVVMAILPLTFYAQDGKKSRPAERYWYIQADGGLSINHGDLANYNGWIFDDFNHYKMQAFKSWNAHLGFGYQFSKVVGFNIKGGYGLLNGHKHNQALVWNDADNPVMYDLALTNTNYIEGSINLTFNLFNMFNYNPRRVINFVPHIGFGGVYYQAGAVNQVDANDQVGDNSELRAKKTNRELTFAVPAGMEITFNIAPKFDLFLDYTYNFTGSDKLDQVAKIKVDEDKHVINDKDMYSQLNLGLRVKFNNPCDIEKMARDAKNITYRVNPDPLVADENGNVCFDVITTIPAEYFEKQAVMNLTPYLAYNGGQIDLDPITFVGEKVKENGDFRVNYKEGGEFTKHYCIPYQPEMENSKLMGNPMFYVYDGKIYPTQDEIVKNTYFTQGGERKLADGVIYHKPTPPAPTPVPTPQPPVVVEPDFIYYFDYNKSDILGRGKDVRDRNKTARQLMKEKLTGDVKNVRVEGWASPEDRMGMNNQLSNDRANAAINDMKAQLKKDAANFNFNGKGNGSDWDTFMKLIENSNIKDKDAILNNIKKSSNRQQTIQEMIDIYPQIEKEILPLIRRAEVYLEK